MLGVWMMNDQGAQVAPVFGGRWTEEKLAILERYLDVVVDL